MSDQYWQDKHADYSTRDWSLRPSIFAESIVDLLPGDGRLLDLGAGLGQDSVFFAAQGYDVVSTDLLVDDEVELAGVKRLAVDHGQKLPFMDGEFDVVYSHLGLHYFDTETTGRVFSEIRRVLKIGGVVAFLVNSINDPEYDTGTKIEDDYFEISGTTKRYFSAQTAREFAKDFEVILCDESGETYKDTDKGVHNLVRFVGKKV